MLCSICKKETKITELQKYDKILYIELSCACGWHGYLEPEKE
jgi:hypothetical protein